MVRTLVRVATASCMAVSVVVAAMTPGASATPASPAPSYPVFYSPAAAIGAIGDPAGPPPGANNWTCKPTATHPEPVVLVHGLGANMADNWATLAPLLADNGYCVFALTYGADPGENTVGGLQAMEQSSQQLAAFVDQVRAATGAAKVDLLGHSEGTVMPQYFLKFLGGAAKVDRYVALTPLYRGTTLDGLQAGLSAFEQALPALATPIHQAVAAGCGSCQEFLTGSPFLTHLYADGVYAVAPVTYTTIMTRYDEAVTPYTSGQLHAPNATNIVLQDQCGLDYSEHVTVAYDPVAAQDVLNALDPAHPHPVPCTLVLPFVGAPLFR